MYSISYAHVNESNTKTYMNCTVCICFNDTDRRTNADILLEYFYNDYF